MTGPRAKLVEEIGVSLVGLRHRANEAFLGLSAQFLDGEYKGRWGKVTAVALDDRKGVCLLVRPYRLEVVKESGLPSRITEEEDLLWNRRDARTYRLVSQYAFVDDYAPCTACGRRVASPCHGWEGYHEEGPWDSFCKELLMTAAKEKME